MVLITPNYLFFISVSLIVFFKSIIKFSYIIVYQGRRKVWKSRVARSIVGGGIVCPRHLARLRRPYYLYVRSIA